MKSIYLADLRQALIDNEIENYEEIVSKYSKRYDFGKESGLSDEEIEEMLGEVSDIVSKYKDEKESPENSFDSDTIYNIKVETSLDDVIFYVTDDAKAKIILDVVNVENYNVVNNREGIIITNKAKFFRQRASGEIKIYVPKSRAINDISISSVNGDIKADIFACNNLNIQLVSGDCEFDKIYAQNFNASIVSGDIAIDLIKANNIRISSVSGDVDIDELESETLKYSAVSGDLTIDKCQCLNCKCQSTSGDISINGHVYYKYVDGEFYSK